MVAHFRYHSGAFFLFGILFLSVCLLRTSSEILPNWIAVYEYLKNSLFLIL